MGNLEAILGYQGARDHGDAVEVAPDIIAMPFWTPDFCATVIRAAQAAGGFEHHPDDPVGSYDLSLAAISPRLFEVFEQDVGARMWPAVRNWWPIVDYHGLRDAFVIHYAIGEQEELRLHRLRRCGTRVPAAGLDQRGCPGGHAHRVAELGDPPARHAPAAQRREVLAHGVVRTAPRPRLTPNVQTEQRMRAAPFAPEALTDLNRSGWTRHS
jgi:hypothetical protein